MHAEDDFSLQRKRYANENTRKHVLKNKPAKQLALDSCCNSKQLSRYYRRASFIIFSNAPMALY